MPAARSLRETMGRDSAIDLTSFCRVAANSSVRVGCIGFTPFAKSSLRMVPLCSHTSLGLEQKYPCRSTLLKTTQCASSSARYPISAGRTKAERLTTVCPWNSVLKTAC